MPVVPVYDPNQIRPQPVSTAPRHAPEQDVRPLVEGVQQLAGAVMDYAAVEDHRLRELDEASVKALALEYATARDETMWGTPDKPGALAQTGLNAVTATQEARGALGVRRREIEGRAQGARQQAMLGQILATQSAEADGQMRRWEVQQTVQGNIDNGAALIDMRATEAARASDDPAAMQTAMTALDAAVVDQAELLGVPMTGPDGKQSPGLTAMLYRARDPMFREVVGNLLDTDPARALQIVETSRDLMSENAYLTLRGAAQKADREGSVLREADAVFLANGQDYGRAMTFVAGIVDPLKRQAMESRLGFLRNAKITATADEAQATLTRLLPGAMGGGFDALPATDRMAAERLGIADNLRAAGTRSTVAVNGPTYLNTLQIMRTPAGRTFALGAIAADVTPAELIDLYKTQAAGFDRYQASIEPGANKVMARLEPLITVAIPGKTPADRARVKAQAEAYVYGQLRMRVAANEDIDEAVIAATVERAMTPVGTGYYFQTQTSTLGAAEYSATFEALRGTLGRAPTRTEMEDFVSGEGKPVPFGKIPVRDRNAIIDQLRKDYPGKRVMEADVEAEYRAFLIGGE